MVSFSGSMIPTNSTFPSSSKKDNSDEINRHDRFYDNGLTKTSDVNTDHISIDNGILFHSKNYSISNKDFVTMKNSNKSISLDNRASSLGSLGSISSTSASALISANNLKIDDEIASQFTTVKNLIAASEKADASECIPGKGSPKANIQQEAVKLLRKLATTSSSNGKLPLLEAIILLGEVYEKGALNLRIEKEKAFCLFINAAKLNDPLGAFKVGNCYEIGSGTKKDTSKAIQFYRKASALGNPNAMHRLGMILLKGKYGVTKNEREGVTWLQRAVSLSRDELPEALYDLACCFEKNACAAVIPDELYAFELYERAAFHDHTQSQHRLGVSYEYGQMGREINPNQSIAWYQQAAEKGYAEAQLALSGWYLTGSSGILPQSEIDAYIWARKAADQNLPKAEFALGHFSEFGIGVNGNLEEAKRWYSRASSHGSVRGNQRLGELKKNEKISSKSKSKSNVSINQNRKLNNSNSFGTKKSTCTII